ncbi:MAG: glutamate 5-kinase [Nanoarchaeota archaeon]
MKIIIKIGSALLSKGNIFNYKFLESTINEISKIHKENEIVIITSGAVALGMEIENIKERPKEILKLQLLSGEGQVKLINYYYELFKKNRIDIAQILLTHHNFSTQGEKDNFSKIISEYLKQKVIPIINENDLISKEELNYKNLFSDNDILAALIAKEIKADLLLILTNVDGLYDSNPNSNKNAKVIELVNNINEKIKAMASKETNSLGLGGMYSKILAAEMVKKDKVKTIIANGKYSIIDILNNKVKRTLFEVN